MTACEAWIPGFGTTCGAMWPDEATQRVRRACLHEHVREGWACELHIESAAYAFCLTCFKADGHECPIAIVPIEAVAGA